MATRVTLRTKPLKDQTKNSLYLEFYPPIPHPRKEGKVLRKEYLKMHIHVKPKTPLDKQHNKNTLQLAEQIRQKWEYQVNKPEIYTEFEREQLKQKERAELSFINYFKHLAKTRKESNRNNWESALYYLETFTNRELNGQELRFADITEQFCSHFKHYMQNAPSKRSPSTPLAQNSASSFFNKFKAALREAYREGYLIKDINATISSIPPAETNREYLTPSELALLATIPCKDTILKKAAFFSALTGLRFSDIQKLTWGEVRHIEDKRYYIVFRQKKTNGQETLPIPDAAYQLLGSSRKSLDRPRNYLDRVFEDLQYSAYQNTHLVQWTKDAGIQKHITFHSFRHTFAIHKLLEGTDIYTVSKLLGHRDLKTTQIYAKIVDSMKREAMDKTSIILDMKDFES